VFFEFERDVSLGGQQRLLARVVARHEMQIGFGDFDVITENFIKADAQTFDSGSFALSFFQAPRKIPCRLLILAEVYRVPLKNLHE
jgi:hypothetical protein